MAITPKIRALIQYANEKTGAADTTLGDAVKTLCDGYMQGGGGDKGHGLPDEYQEVEWVGASRDVSFSYPARMFTVPNTIRIKMRWHDRNSRQLMGVGNNYIGCDASGVYETRATSIGIPVSIDGFDEVVRIQFTNGSVLCINNYAPSSLAQAGSNGNAQLNMFSAYGYKCACDVAELQFTEADGDVYHLIPCYRKSDNAIGFYNLVDSTFSQYGTSKGEDI